MTDDELNDAAEELFEALQGIKEVQYRHIQPAVELICAELNLEPDDVAKLTLTPKFVIAEVYLRNDAGSKYVDATTDKVATETRSYWLSREDDA